MNRPQLHPPRNAAAVARLDAGDFFVASLVDTTPVRAAHVYLDPGRRYDWSFARGRYAVLATRRGVQLERHLLRDLIAATEPWLTLLDRERGLVASVVDHRDGSIHLRPYAKRDPLCRHFLND